MTYNDDISCGLIGVQVSLFVKCYETFETVFEMITCIKFLVLILCTVYT